MYKNFRVNCYDAVVFCKAIEEKEARNVRKTNRMPKGKTNIHYLLAGIDVQNGFSKDISPKIFKVICVRVY